MSDVPPSEKIPGSSSNGPFGVIAVLLALALGGMLFWKFKGAEPEESKPTTTAVSAKPTSAARPALTDSIPPPPDEDKTEDKPDAGASTKKVGTGGGPCGGSCTGTPSSGTSGDLKGRRAVAQGCYERALRTNSTIQGKVTVNVRVDPSGTICSASASGDTLGAPDVTGCILSAFRGQKVAPPTGGCADTTLTFNFQSKNKLSSRHDRFPPCLSPNPRLEGRAAGARFLLPVDVPGRGGLQRL